MEFWLYIGIYSFSLIIIWGFYIIARIHSMKFKNYQPSIIRLTNIASISLFILSILGYIFIFVFSNSINKIDLREIPKNEINNENDGFSDLSEKDIIPGGVGEDFY